MDADRSSENRTFFGLTFPEKIEGAAYKGFLDNETEHPGLGYSVAYSGPEFDATVYIYDRRLCVIPNDHPSAALLEEFDRAEMEIVLSGHEQVRAAPHNLGSLRKGGPAMLMVSFVIPSISGEHDWDHSFLGLTAWNNKFIKFRLTTRHSESSAEKIRLFMAGWADALSNS
jgi:hypothetical protein